MKVRLTQQVQGTRDGQAWPEPGTEVDLPDAEAQALISGGAAVDPNEDSPKVLVPPQGVHTPGRTAMPADATAPLVEVPADAVSDPDGVRDALRARAESNYVEGPAGVAHQKSTGLAHTEESLKKAGKAEERTREALGAPVPTVGQDQPVKTPAKAQPAKADKG